MLQVATNLNSYSQAFPCSSPVFKKKLFVARSKGHFLRDLSFQRQWRSASENPTAGELIIDANMILLITLPLDENEISKWSANSIRS